MQVRKYRWHTALMSNVQNRISAACEYIADAMTRWYAEIIVSFAYLSSEYYIRNSFARYTNAYYKNEYYKIILLYTCYAFK